MAKKKSGKKKGGKLAKMTEEERILYLEQKALEEEEMRKKKEDMLLQFLKVCYIISNCNKEIKKLIFSNLRVLTGCWCLVLPWLETSVLFPSTLQIWKSNVKI